MTESLEQQLLHFPNGKTELPATVTVDKLNSSIQPTVKIHAITDK